MTEKAKEKLIEIACAMCEHYKSPDTHPHSTARQAGECHAFIIGYEIGEGEKNENRLHELCRDVRTWEPQNTCKRRVQYRLLRTTIENLFEEQLSKEE
jgi:hypothetical protein